MSAAAPPRVRRGQTLGIVAPAGPVDVDRMKRGLARLGEAFELRIADNIFAERSPNVPSYLAASDAARAAELNAMLADPDVRGIVLARGGYGLMRILDELDAASLVRDPKPIVGFSDATALLAWAHHLGVRGIHGPMAVQLGDLPAEDVAHLVAMLSEPRVPGLRPWFLASHGTGVHRGPLVPANLTLASMLVGSPWPLPLAGAIALFEEVGERPYELDRYLTQLSLTGAIAETRAVIVGELLRCWPQLCSRCTDAGPPAGGTDADDAALFTVLERLAAADLPAASGAPVGHGTRNEAVPFGAACVLDLDHHTIEITEAAVA
ncbi:MAG: LD-carboxypeptidase [Deltaproteobacteria bacterium]|nr:LD-carboxypeptidase [Deltaproteobacteria bacterium]MDQ3300533.1 LD-carboxypeptidase [Myxococcota bacterium]